MLAADTGLSPLAVIEIRIAVTAADRSLLVGAVDRHGFALALEPWRQDAQRGCIAAGSRRSLTELARRTGLDSAVRPCATRIDQAALGLTRTERMQAHAGRSSLAIAVVSDAVAATDRQTVARAVLGL